ncbi:MAG: TolC family protein [Bacillota bacterium]
MRFNAKIKLMDFVIIGIMVFSLMFPLKVAAQSNGLSLQEARELAEANDIEFQIAEVTLDNARLRYEMNLARNLRSESRYQELSAELAYNRAQENNRQTRVSIYLGLINDYQNIVNLDQELDIARRERDLASREVENTQQEVEQGLSSRIELLQQQIAYNNAAFDVITLEADLEQQARVFSASLGLEELPELTSKVQPVGQLEMPSTQEAVAAALSESFQVEAAEIEKDLAEIDLARAEAVETPDLELKELENSLELTELELTQVGEDVEETALERYHQVEQSYRQVELARDNLEQAEEHRRITREQRQAGLVSASALEEAEVEYHQAGLRLDEARTNYLLAYFELQNMLGVELEVLLDEIFSVIST